MSVSSLLYQFVNAPQTLVNSILDPHPSYPDVIDLSSNQKDTELGLEHLYSLESMGIQEEKDYGTTDKEFITKFHNSIQFIDGKYHIEIPWIQDLLHQVPSNYNVCLLYTSDAADERSSVDLG